MCCHPSDEPLKAPLAASCCLSHLHVENHMYDVFICMHWCLSVENYVKWQVYLWILTMQMSVLCTLHFFILSTNISDWLTNIRTHTCQGSHQSLNPYQMLRTWSPGRCDRSEPAVKNKQKHTFVQNTVHVAKSRQYLKLKLRILHTSYISFHVGFRFSLITWLLNVTPPMLILT